MFISRRSFLRASGAGSVLGAGTAALAQTGAAPVGANDRVQVACIGFGIMGQGDVATEAALPGVEIVAVADVYQGRLTLARERYGSQVFVSRDYREVLARPGVDAVIVATPDHWHAQIAKEALLAGKDVYCQKPMVQKVEDGHIVIEAEKQSGRILQVGSQRASSLLYAKAKELIAGGAIGDVHMVEAFLDRNSAMGAWQYSIPPDASPETIDWDRFIGSAPKHAFEPVRLFRWRNYRDYGTGIAGDLFVHQFTGIHFVMNTLGPERVYAGGGTYFWKDGRDVPDLMVGTFDYPETSAHKAFQISLRVNFEAGGAGGADGQGFRFIGTDGVLNLSVGNAITVTRRRKNSGGPGTTAGTFAKATAQQILNDYRQKYPPQEETITPAVQETYSMPRGYSEQVAHHKVFLDAVRTRKPVVEDATFGLRAAGPALLSNISYFEKRVVEWDPVNMRIKG
ncbi:MAG TPA: Gfo/Idh/MocA family oxidoreductase [Bryobacteraceae bacterium]|nr:Gfo/Idh/MocA family oxidoreductase [Bryobacteraceae bacterium]